MNKCHQCEKVKPGRGIMGRWICYDCRPMSKGSPRYLGRDGDNLPIIKEKKGWEQ